jgi:hypothetical protein
MHSRKWAAAFLAALLLACWRPAAPAAAGNDDATLLRVFLKDGTSLVSYGEPARIDDRVVFSMPTASTPDPPLHLVSVAASRVDWERTDRYATAARAAHYVATQAELDYTALSARMTQALKDLATSDDPARRVAIAEDVRKTLADWPRDHYNYRSGEVRQMLSLLDEAIADLRAATGDNRFAISLSAFAEAPPIVETLAPAPTPKEVIEQVLLASRLADNNAERAELLETALAGLDRDSSILPAEWVAATRMATKGSLDHERLIDSSYLSLTKQILGLADSAARAADVHGLTRLVDRIYDRDIALGSERPETVASLVAAVETRLDAARRLRLARDRWALRAPMLRRYEAAMQAPMQGFAALEPALERIKELAGSSPVDLAQLDRSTAQLLAQARAIVPPAELDSPHALLVSALQLAASAAQIRREATLAASLPRAWDASSAAAGALMLGSRASADLQRALHPPQLR